MSLVYPLLKVIRNLHYHSPWLDFFSTINRIFAIHDGAGHHIKGVEQHCKKYVEIVWGNSDVVEAVAFLVDIKNCGHGSNYKKSGEV
uniref:Ovule protein n=1 Tax=Strongyloides venezuelensis TaxID=75913 RepID=A0A0K0G0A6_STRVS